MPPKLGRARENWQATGGLSSTTARVDGKVGGGNPVATCVEYVHQLPCSNRLNISCVWFYFQLYSETETVPDPAAPAPILPEGRKVRVFSDIRQLQTHLTHDRFEVVDTQDTADIWWVKDHFKDYRLVEELML